MNNISLQKSNNFLPKELWGKIFENIEDPEIVFSVNKLFRDLYHDENQICQWLVKNLNSRGLYYISNPLKDSQDLILAKKNLVRRLIEYRPKSTLDYFRNKEIVRIHEFIKLFQEEDAINLIHVYEKIPLEKPDFAGFNLQEQALAIRSFFEKNKTQLELIEELKLVSLFITAIPEELDILTGLTEIDLRGNCIAFLPSSFGITWTKLEKCDLSYNKLKVLPKKFGCVWKNLTSLNLSNNQLTKISSSFGNQWEMLKCLSIGFNQLKTFPNTYEHWKNLTSLQVTKNMISFEQLQKINHAFPWLVL